MHVFVLTCKILTCKHQNMRVSMYFLHLELTFTPIMDKGQLGGHSGEVMIIFYI